MTSIDDEDLKKIKELYKMIRLQLANKGNSKDGVERLISGIDDFGQVSLPGDLGFYTQRLNDEESFIGYYNLLNDDGKRYFIDQVKAAIPKDTLGDNFFANTYRSLTGLISNKDRQKFIEDYAVKAGVPSADAPRALTGPVYMDLDANSQVRVRSSSDASIYSEAKSELDYEFDDMKPIKELYKMIRLQFANKGNSKAEVKKLMNDADNFGQINYPESIIADNRKALASENSFLDFFSQIDEHGKRSFINELKEAIPKDTLGDGLLVKSLRSASGMISNKDRQKFIEEYAVKAGAAKYTRGPVGMDQSLRDFLGNEAVMNIHNHSGGVLTPTATPTNGAAKQRNDNMKSTKNI